MEELLELLEGVKPGVDFKNEKDLIGTGILDSISIVEIVGELNDEFDIEISPIDIVPENFTNVDAIYALVQRLQED